MNMNKGMDPMLSSFTGDSIWNTKIIADFDTPPSHFLSLTPSDPISPATDSMLSSPDINSTSFSDLASLWSSERKRVVSVKIEEDEGFSDVGSSELDLEEDDIIRENMSDISAVSDDVLDSGDDEVLCKSESTNFVISSEAEARKFVEEKFLQIAYVPNSRFSHKEKIQYILSLSDCSDFNLDQVMNLDKKSSESARICAKIVQNIPQRYRWECVKPEQIPCCYTIVADCKKLYSRDKPPRPMNAFMIWAQGARRLINELCPKMQNAAISEALGYCWRQKPDSFKKKFEMEKVKLRRFHDIEFPAYKYKPKTKVQKAKEKEELSLSKAKLSKTATKRKKSCDNNIVPKESNGRKGRCGRPKKIKLSTDQPKVSKSQKPQQHTQSVEPVKMSPTKPAIKDMLTLKILNDRRSKELAVANSPPQENIHHFLGQLSPTEVDNSHTSDIFDEMRDLESGSLVRGKDISHHHFISSSVYDTPANTPPVDSEEESATRLSPVLLHKTHQPTYCMSTKHTPSTSASSTQQNQVLSRPAKHNNNKCLLSPQASMPSLTAILSSGRNNVPARDSHTTTVVAGLTTPDIAAPSTTTRLIQHENAGTTQQRINATNSRFKPRLSSTDVILSCVSEMLDFPESKKDPTKPLDLPILRDSNNNTNNYFDFNNNSLRSWEGFNVEMTTTTPVSLNPKFPVCGPSKIFDFNDIDMLCPDFNVPLLSDDVMSSLMNTL